jgi:hypothetical protein
MLLKAPGNRRRRFLRVTLLKKREVAEERFDQEVAIHSWAPICVRSTGAFLSSDPSATNLESDKIMTETLLFPFRWRKADFDFLQRLVRAKCGRGRAGLSPA